MPSQDTTALKEKIVSFIRLKGPSLPVHISKETGLTMLFASAFLSELLAEKRIKTSAMKIGTSPLYLIQGQEELLEKFYQHLKSKEKEAFQLLKEKGIIKDSEQEPAIRVALTYIKDFAIPIQKNNELYWRYLTYEEPKTEIKPKEAIKLEKPELEKESIIKETETRKKTKSKKNSKNKDKFLEKVKEFLSRSSVEIINIEGFKKNELLLRIKLKEQEQLLVAYNKKKITEKEIIQSAKKANEMGLNYSILSLGELPKKISELIEALKNIKEIERIKE